MVIMRIDKYLKEAKIIKRRKTSKDLAEANKIVVNGIAVKPSYEVKVNDQLSIKVKDKIIIVKITKDPATLRVNDLATSFEVIGPEK
jgi:ribosomal 50S subunit-recycling heat shock protein